MTTPKTVDGFGLPLPAAQRGPVVGGLELDPEALTRWILWTGIVLAMTGAILFWGEK